MPNLVAGLEGTRPGVAWLQGLKATDEGRPEPALRPM